jgi:hypothetical protein
MSRDIFSAGDVSHGSLDSGKPVKIGGRATEEEPAVVQDGDRVNIAPDLRGNLKIVGNVAHDTADRGNPIKTGGVARTTNPTAVADGDRINASYDDVGRALTVPYQVRDLISTGVATLTRVTETTIISGVASVLLDLIYASGSNTSSVSRKVILKYGGVDIDTMVIPATDTIIKSYPIPIPMSEVAQAISAQVVETSGEISDSPVSITAIAIRNV